MSAPSDAALVRRYLETHDERAFEALHRRHDGHLRGQALRAGLRAGDVDDLVQHAWLKALRHLHRYDAAKGAFGTWMYVIVARLAGNHHVSRGRSRSRHAYSLDAPFSDDADSAARGSVVPGPAREWPDAVYERSDLLARVLAGLPALDPSGVLAEMIEGHGYEELAKRRGVELGTIKSRGGRARRKVRARFGDAYRELVGETEPPPRRSARSRTPAAA